MRFISPPTSRFTFTLAILLPACHSAPPSSATPENLTFRSFRLEGAQPAGFGYSVITDRRVWEQFLRDRAPHSSSHPPEISKIDFSAQSLAVLQAASGTQCFGDPVVRRVSRKADTTRILLGSLMGPCQMADYWIEVIVIPHVRGPVRLDYPLPEYRPEWIDQEIELPLDPKDAGFAAAPDSLPAWLRSDSSFIAPSSYIPQKFARNIVVIDFRPEATPADRRSAIELVGGRLVGGIRRTGRYLVRVADPGDGSGIERAADRLRALDDVPLATPYFGE